MVWGEEIAEPISIRHTQKKWKHSIHSLMDEFEETQKQTEEMIKRLLGTYMSYGQMGMLAERVSEELLSPEITGSVFDPTQLNTAHRKEDIGKDAWHTFNRIQYNLLQGGVDRIIEKEDDNGILIDTVSKTHKITDTKKQIEFNRSLHSMIMETI
jgi:hypothetical protein